MIEACANSASPRSSQSELITLQLTVAGVSLTLTALVDTGASSNFARSSSLSELPSASFSSSSRDLIITLADGSKLRVAKRTVLLEISFDEFKEEDEFILLDLDQKFDIILGMPWLKRHRPLIDWDNGCLSSFRTIVGLSGMRRVLRGLGCTKCD